MRIVIQRVSEASVTIDAEVSGEIGSGLLVLVGIEENDSAEDVSWLTAKISSLRIFNDADGVMNLSLKDIGGQMLIVSQFTLHALTKKGNRPSYVRAARPEKAIPLYEMFVRECETRCGSKAATGKFGADMKVALVNDGPVTIIIDSKNRE